MIAVDTNVLVYAHRAESDFHSQAFGHLKALAEGGQPWGIPVSCLHEFLSTVTNQKIFNTASKFEEVLGQVDAWLASPQAHVLRSGSQHWRILSELTRKAKPQGSQYNDAHIAALCIENDVSALWNAERDFWRFKGLKTVNPPV